MAGRTMKTKAGAWLFTDLMTNETPFRKGDEPALEGYVTNIEQEAASAALNELLEKVNERHAQNIEAAGLQDEYKNQHGADVYTARYSEDAWVSIEIRRMLK